MTETQSGTKEAAGAAPSVRAAADELKGEGLRLATETKEAATQLVEGRKSDAERFLRGLASAAASGARTLEDDGHRASASIAGQAADELGRLAERLSERQLSDLVDGVEDVARRRPALFFCAAFVAGFGAMRLLRSTAHREEGRQGAQGEFAKGSSP